MTDVKQLAFQIAEKAFKGKVDKSGKPYFNHLVRVSQKFKENDFLYPIAMLHDLLEHCPEWTEEALRCLFDDNVVSTIADLIKKDNEDYFDYIDRINQSVCATKIKLADLEDNMDITRLENLEVKDFERLKRYLKAYKILKQKVMLTITKEDNMALMACYPDNYFDLAIVDPQSRVCYLE